MNANADAIFTIGVAYEDQSYNAFQPFCGGTTGLICKKKHYLQWTNNSCYANPAGYNWYDTGSLTDMISLGGAAADMSSFKNYSVGCNRIWLISGNHFGKAAGYIYTQCLKPGAGIPWFGEPYNDNIRQLGLGRDPQCPSS